jgi:hypothetical protein
LAPSAASADEASVADWAQHLVESNLVKPLADFEAQSSRFSRARPLPRERRVRALQTAVTPDKDGRTFVPFAIDVRFGGGEWVTGDIVGCAYTGSGNLYVKRGDDFRPASFLLGKNEAPVAGVCVAGPARS